MYLLSTAILVQMKKCEIGIWSLSDHALVFLRFVSDEKFNPLPFMDNRILAVKTKVDKLKEALQNALVVNSTKGMSNGRNT